MRRDEPCGTHGVKKKVEGQERMWGECPRHTDRPPNWDVLLGLQVPSGYKTSGNHSPPALPGSTQPHSPAQGHVEKDTHGTMNSSGLRGKEAALQMYRVNVKCNVMLLHVKKQLGEQYTEHDPVSVRTGFTKLLSVSLFLFMGSG